MMAENETPVIDEEDQEYTPSFEELGAEIDAGFRVGGDAETEGPLTRDEVKTAEVFIERANAAKGNEEELEKINEELKDHPTLGPIVKKQLGQETTRTDSDISETSANDLSDTTADSTEKTEANDEGSDENTEETETELSPELKAKADQIVNTYKTSFDWKKVARQEYLMRIGELKLEDAKEHTDHTDLLNLLLEKHTNEQLESQDPQERAYATYLTLELYRVAKEGIKAFWDEVKAEHTKEQAEKQKKEAERQVEQERISLQNSLEDIVKKIETGLRHATDDNLTFDTAHFSNINNQPQYTTLQSISGEFDEFSKKLKTFSTQNGTSDELTTAQTKAEEAIRIAKDVTTKFSNEQVNSYERTAINTEQKRTQIINSFIDELDSEVKNQLQTQIENYIGRKLYNRNEQFSQQYDIQKAIFDNPNVELYADNKINFDISYSRTQRSQRIEETQGTPRTGESLDFSENSGLYILSKGKTATLNNILKLPFKDILIEHYQNNEVSDEDISKMATKINRDVYYYLLGINHGYSGNEASGVNAKDDNTSWDSFDNKSEKYSGNQWYQQGVAQGKALPKPAAT
jgi:hypothetical protein